jgi:hypothetical protein
MITTFFGCNYSNLAPNKDNENKLVDKKDNKTHLLKDQNAVNYLANLDEKRIDDRKIESFNCIGIPGLCVQSITWGKIKVIKDNKIRTHKDAIIWWQGSKEWDWNKFDVHHDPGITKKAVNALLSLKNVTDIILTKGMEGVLKIPKETIEHAKKKNIKIHIAFTRDAVKLFNDLIKSGKMVAALIHTTC